ncbi:patatin-like phospholipase family protein [Bacillus sp. Marseille-P3661]|uniref:patatin-like phospholipase family protein n=1 Tax=Bacillus sp. Marseille-P3661 TaxID=1936234 RepID=UPI000C85CC2E|nr:patatin family protein [Bacillus sp. Marseille-P3661]
MLEGGGMRGVFTAGVLHFFMEQELYFQNVIGVSSGACQGSSYISRQLGRNKKVTIDYIDHPKYISYRNLIKNRELFGMDFIFDELPKKHVPFDFLTFHQAKERFITVTTDCRSGEPVYFEKGNDSERTLKLLRASSSLPFMAPIVKIEGRELLDGGLADPLPIKKLELDGCKKNVLILTRNKGYRKSRGQLGWLIKRAYRNYPGLVLALENRYRIYNDTMDYIEDQEKKGHVFVIRPTQSLKVSRVERNKDKLTDLYLQGYKEIEGQFDNLKEWLHY